MPNISGRVDVKPIFWSKERPAELCVFSTSVLSKESTSSSSSTLSIYLSSVTSDGVLTVSPVPDSGIRTSTASLSASIISSRISSSCALESSPDCGVLTVSPTAGCWPYLFAINNLFYLINLFPTLLTLPISPVLKTGTAKYSMSPMLPLWLTRYL